MKSEVRGLMCRVWEIAGQIEPARGEAKFRAEKTM